MNRKLRPVLSDPLIQPLFSDPLIGPVNLRPFNFTPVKSDSKFQTSKTRGVTTDRLFFEIFEFQEVFHLIT